MWIEVIGLPGVGKTTMIEKNISFIQKNYTIIESKSPSLYQRLIAKILYYMHYRNKIQDQNLSLKLAYRHSFRFSKSKSGNIFFYDSGMIQIILENLIETNFERAKQKLEILSQIPLPHHLIYIEDSLNNIVEREVKRPESRFNLEFSETKRRYQHALKIIEKELLQSVEIIDIIPSGDDQKFIKALQHEKTS